MKKLFPFALALVLVGQGCVFPPTGPSEDSQAYEDATMEEHDDSTMEGGDSMEAGATIEGEAVMEDGVAVFTVTGHNFAYNPNVIRVQKGQKMRIVFSSTQGFHDWVVDEFDASTIRVNESDGEVIVEFTPNEAGVFEFYCSVGQHRANGMVGTLIVEESEAAEEDGSLLEMETRLEGSADVHSMGTAE